MATPRLFISSTCYDLQEIRFQLRRFIEEIGYEPVMSDFGDIFYDLGQHVQDACKEEINKCNIFILVIGNNYGSIYHKHSNSPHIPDSITVQEFRKAIEVGIPKFIFINRFVQHDFENYRRALSKHTARYFAENEVSNNEISTIKTSIKKKFDNTYPFPQEAYRYVFYFLEDIYNLDINNAIYPFESFDHIKDNLRKQWAGIVYEALTKHQRIPLDRINILEQKLEKIENQLKLLLDGITSRNDNQTVSFDIASLTRGLNIENLSEIQDRIDEILMDLLYDNDFNDNYYPLIQFTEELNELQISQWLDNIGKLIKEFKWSKEIPSSEIFSMLRHEYTGHPYSLPHKLLLEFYGITNSFNEDDKVALINTILVKFNNLIVKPTPSYQNSEEVPF